MLDLMKLTRRFLAAAILAIIVLAAQPVFSQDQGDGSDRAFLQYEIQKVDPWGPFALNLLLGLGIGSFVQGDTTGGLLVAGGEVVGLGLLLAGAASVVQDPQGPGGTMGAVGVGLLVAARIAGLVFPFTYANTFNEKLRQDLGIAISVAPGDGVNVTVSVET